MSRTEGGPRGIGLSLLRWIDTHAAMDRADEEPLTVDWLGVLPYFAVVTLGEVRHNDHHRYPVATRQGFYWWELDLTYYGLLFLKWLGVIWDVKAAPPRVRESWRDERAAA